MTISSITCLESNYSKTIRKSTDFIVIHYTSNDGDSASGNGSYFGRVEVGASAHIFVDQNGYCKSVPIEMTAWHCGAKTYKHPKCRNNNSIGIEMCSKKDSNGQYYIPQKTIENTQKIVKELMDKYNIGTDNVIRHYDVTGKNCPEPMVRLPKNWDDFKKGLVSNMTVDDAKNIIQNSCKFSDDTMKYLEFYKYSDSLLIRLAEAIEG